MRWHTNNVWHWLGSGGSALRGDSPAHWFLVLVLAILMMLAVAPLLSR